MKFFIAYFLMELLTRFGMQSFNDPDARKVAKQANKLFFKKIFFLDSLDKVCDLFLSCHCYCLVVILLNDVCVRNEKNELILHFLFIFVISFCFI